MELFALLLWKITPLYINILLGFLMSRFLAVDRGAIASMLFYIIGPVVVFNATVSVHIEPAVVLLPIFFYIFSTCIAFLYLKIFSGYWTDSTGNMLAFSAGTGNVGYFGIALALILFPPELADVFIFTVLGAFFYEATSGFYVTAKGIFTARQSIARVVRLPVLYAFLLAIVFNVSKLELPVVVLDYTRQFGTVYSILGMMVIGMGLEGLRQHGGVDRRFLQISLTAKHLVWPLLIAVCIYFDKTITHLLSDELHKVMFVFAIVPMAGNTVTLAVLLKARPEKAALGVLISTLLSLVLIPLCMTLYELTLA